MQSPHLRQQIDDLHLVSIGIHLSLKKKEEILQIEYKEKCYNNIQLLSFREIMQPGINQGVHTTILEFPDSSSFPLVWHWPTLKGPSS